MDTSYRRIAAYLMLLSGVTHPAQMLVYGTAPEIRGPATTGMIFLLIGAGLLTPWRACLWLAIALPLAGGLGALFRITADVPTAFTYFHALIDFVVVGLAGASLAEGHPTLGRWLRRTAIALTAVVGGGFILLFSALRDNPARPSVGELRVAQSPEADIEYYAGGPQTGHVIVLLPSFARSAADFNELATALSHDGYRTLAIQPRGVEGSELPSMLGTLHTYAGDVDRVLAAEGAGEPVVLLGHAYGNRVARTFASDFPERTRAVILLAAGGAGPTPPKVGTAILLATLRIVPEARRREAIDLAFFAEGNPVTDDWLRGWYPRAGIAEQNASSATPYSEWGAGGTAPILVLEADEDAVAGHAGAQLQAQFPDRVQVRKILNAGHALLNERPQRIHDGVTGYLATLF
ncbi:MAG: alpha/beta fold hydrolase [Myxococcota bacterium]|nr:alpha/beta fold hydrolase [Myxococcota bacterium]